MIAPDLWKRRAPNFDSPKSISLSVAFSRAPSGFYNRASHIASASLFYIPHRQSLKTLMISDPRAPSGFYNWASHIASVSPFYIPRRQSLKALTIGDLVRRATTNGKHSPAGRYPLASAPFLVSCRVTT